MKKIFIVLALLAVLSIAARPYVAVSWDEWGFALSGRTSISQKFQPWLTFPAVGEIGGRVVQGHTTTR